MRTYPQHAGPPQEEPSAATGSGADEPRVPRPLPSDDRKGSRAALAILLLGLAIIALVILL